MTSLTQHSADPTPAQILAAAVDKGADADTLERLVGLAERVMDRRAERDMDAALAAFQAQCPTIPHDKDTRKAGKGGRSYGYTYASLAQIEKTIRPVLSQNGLSFSHSFEMLDANAMRCTCTLRHESGAERHSTFTGPALDGGSMNGIQKAGSARSYMRRYTLIDVLGLTTAEGDDDAHSAAAPSVDTISAEQAEALKALAKDVGANVKGFCAYLRVTSIDEIPAFRYDEATELLEKKRGSP